MSNKDQAARVTRAKKPARSSTTHARTEAQPNLSTATETQQRLPQTSLDPHTLQPGDLLRLQRSVGNQAVQRLVAARQIQAKLTVGAHVMRRPAVLQRMPLEKMLPKTWYTVKGFVQPLYLFSTDKIGRECVFLENPHDYSNGVHVIGEDKVLAYHNQALPVLKSKFNILKRLDKSAFDEAVKEQGAVGYADDISKMGEYDRARGFKRGVFTAEMDNCITVGFTAKTQTARINAILHSMQTGPDVVTNIFEQLAGLMLKIESELGQPEDIQYYVVGGNVHPESQAKATEILQHLLLNDLPVMGIALPTDQTEAHLMKGVLNTAGGEVVYTTYEPKKVEKKEEVPVQFGFSGFTTAKNLFSKNANK